MKKLILFFNLFVISYNTLCQSTNVDSSLQNIAAEKNESKRIGLILNFFSDTEQSNLKLDNEKAQALLKQSLKNEDKVSITMSLSQIGVNYRLCGDAVNGLLYFQKALLVAEQIENLELQALIKNDMGNIYRDRGENERAINLYMASLQNSSMANNDTMQSWTLKNIGIAYLSMHKTDSALMYAQRAFDLCTKINYTNYMCDILTLLGNVHAKMGDPITSVNYLNEAVIFSKKMNASSLLSKAYTGLSQFYFSIAQADSCIYYAKKAIEVLDSKSYSNLKIQPAKMLGEIYKSRNCDSALKYFTIYRTANDSLFSAKIIQQTQALTIQEDMRQNQLAEEAKLNIEIKRHNIQYALIGICTILMTLAFLVLGNRFIINPKLIKLLATVVLMIAFQFFYLMLSPFITFVDSYSPLLNFLVLVLLAASMAPFYNKITSRVIEYLVEKNIKLRLILEQKRIDETQNKNSNKSHS